MSTRRSTCGSVIMAAGLIILMTGGQAAAQSAVSELPEEPPEVVLYRLGSVLVTPRFAIPEIGHDSNAFNEADNPKQDFVVKFVPEIDFFTDLGALRLAVRSGSTFTYFHRHSSERSIAEQLRGRATLRLSRLQPWVGAASIRSNERTTEVDARAKRVQRELAGGVQFEVSPLADILITANHQQLRYDHSEEFRAVPLARALDRRSDSVEAALRFQATPFTTLRFAAHTRRDEFTFDPTRDSRAVGGDVHVEFSPEAVIRGRVTVGFRHQDFEDPALDNFQGVTARGEISSILLWHALVSVNYNRDVQYSFDRNEGYYVENGVGLTYTQRLAGPFDAQGRVFRQALDFNATALASPRAEVTWGLQGGLGYSLESGSRFGVSYEMANRDVGLIDREYSRHRVFGSFTYEFWR